MSHSLCGVGVAQLLPAKVKKNGYRSLLVVTGNSSFHQSGAATLIKQIEMRGETQVSVFSDFSPNPKLTDVRKGLRFLAKVRPDAIIGIGGGSSLDMAKLISLFSAQAATHSLDHLLTHQQLLQPRQLPLVVIPTTCGSGSEATHFAVVYKNLTKYSVAHTSLVPDLAVIDSQLMMSLSPYQYACGAMDAYSQAVESYWSINATVASKRYATKALNLLTSTLTTDFKQPQPQTRQQIAQAAHLAGQAINITKTTASHALSYKITTDFGVPHGHAVALTLSECMRFNYSLSESDCLHPRGVTFVRKQLEGLALLITGTKDVEQAAIKITQQMNGVKLATRLSEVGVTKKDLPRIVKSVNLERLQNNPRRFSSAQMNTILVKCL